MAKNSLGYGSRKIYPETETQKRCCTCKIYIDKDNFHKGSFSCKPCANASSRRHHARRMIEDPLYREAMKERYTKQTYGLTRTEYIEKLKAQDSLCAICKVELPAGGHLTHLDHCHTTGKIRAFLCTNCNRGLGHFQDRIENLHKAIAYLKSHSSSED
jgi:hypothetical protein